MVLKVIIQMPAHQGTTITFSSEGIINGASEARELGENMAKYQDEFIKGYIDGDD